MNSPKADFYVYKGRKCQSRKCEDFKSFLSTEIHSISIKFMCMNIEITDKSQESPTMMAGVWQEGVSGSFPCCCVLVSRSYPRVRQLEPAVPWCAGVMAGGSGGSSGV